MGNVVHPCRVKSFRKVVSTVTDDLVMDSVILDNLIIKPDVNVGIRIPSQGVEGVILGNRFR